MNPVLDKLEATVKRMPEKDAVEDLDSHLTYRQLQTLARRAGSRLAEEIRPGEPVVLFLEKSCRALALLYGVLYGGGFYVFIDPLQPQERMRRILARLDAGICVTTAENLDRLQAAGFTGQILLADELLSEQTAPDLILLQQRRGEMTAESLLYGIFTSGSTGEPKGVVVSAGAAADFIGHFTDEMGIRPQDRVGNQAPFDFDVSVKDIFSCAFTGATLVLIPRTYFAVPRSLLDYLQERKITVLIWAVSALCMISAFHGFDYLLPQKLRMVMFCGEAMPVRQLQIWQDALPDVQYVNLYGPTEITCNCTYYRLPAGLWKGRTIPIGQPFPGRKVFLLDENGQIITEPECEGQIAVSGESISAGYYHDEERTRQSFVTLDGQRTYLTGDYACFGYDGLLYFHGRRDSQIKHMGHRIELGEVERAMMEPAAVSRACCLFDSEHRRIWGFYEGDIAETDLRMKLKAILPGYMIPGRIFRIRQFRLNKNGKIDRMDLRRKAGIAV